MIIDGKFILENDLVANEDNFFKKHNNFYISQDQINILNNYGIDINNYKSLNELLYVIENYLNNSPEDMDDLDWVSQSLSEYNYYNNTNK